jgi:hypothetical protein
MEEREMIEIAKRFRIMEDEILRLRFAFACVGHVKKEQINAVDAATDACREDMVKMHEAIRTMSGRNK